MSKQTSSESMSLTSSNCFLLIVKSRPWSELYLPCSYPYMQLQHFAIVCYIVW